MKTKSFVPSSKQHPNDNKTTDYWGMLFVGFIFLSSMSCFLFANHSGKQTTNSLSDSRQAISVIITDPDQRQES
ncbi:hypothetical protein HGG82_03425 [Marinomonas sp. M1K-6]|uniref:Uncharacterized protein n=1 Tax=Marinomonas profundi TaxID=2726122 RepID=A0A847R3W7_9GAMM|nr:hypothetical protein [Marinomonas profundi]NLQ16676.1 hypothetical protein [Marinomonas profundi]UDV03747.1 hypothetical protein J8N69_02930 [Marinomonas profundi]